MNKLLFVSSADNESFYNSPWIALSLLLCKIKLSKKVFYYTSST